MNAQVQHRLDQFKESAEKVKSSSVKGKTRTVKLKRITVKDDSLVTALRSKKDADIFMSQLNSIIKKKK